MDDEISEEAKTEFLREVSQVAQSLEMLLKLYDAHPYVAFCALVLVSGSIAVENTSVSRATAIMHMEKAYDQAKQFQIEAKQHVS